MNKRLFIIGMSKSGTTSAYNYLKQNPNYFLPSKKELHYFSSEELMKQNGGPGDKEMLASIVADKIEYDDFYKNANGSQIKVDISPSYFFYPQSIARIIQTYPSSKFILFYRDPISKVFSQYQHLLLDGREEISFFAALEEQKFREKEGYSDMFLYLSSALYLNKLQQILQYINLEDILFINFDKFKLNNIEVMKEIDMFMELDAFHYQIEKHVNVSGEPRFKVISKLTGANKLTVFLKKIIPARIGTLIKENIRKFNTGEKVVLDRESMNVLKKFSSNDYMAFLDIVNRNSDE